MLVEMAPRRSSDRIAIKAQQKEEEDKQVEVEKHQEKERLAEERKQEAEAKEKERAILAERRQRGLLCLYITACYNHQCFKYICYLPAARSG